MRDVKKFVKDRWLGVLLVIVVICTLVICASTTFAKYKSSVAAPNYISLNIQGSGEVSDKAFAVYYGTDVANGPKAGDFVFYAAKELPQAGANGVANVYSIGDGQYETSANVPWLNASNGVKDNIKRVYFDNSFASWKKIVSTKNWFEGCAALDSFDAKNFDSTKVQTTDNMFKNCTALKSIDLSEFAISDDCKSMNNMFYECSALQTIYVKANTNWNNSQRVGDDMFAACNNLIGGCGTRLIADVSINFAKADLAEAAPGYFTSKDSTVSIVQTQKGTVSFVGDDQKSSIMLNQGKLSVSGDAQLTLSHFDLNGVDYTIVATPNDSSTTAFDGFEFTADGNTWTKITTDTNIVGNVMLRAVWKDK